MCAARYSRSPHASSSSFERQSTMTGSSRCEARTAVETSVVNMIATILREAVTVAVGSWQFAVGSWQLAVRSARLLASIHHSVLHHELDAAQRRDVLCRIAFEGGEVGEQAGLHLADLIL